MLGNGLLVVVEECGQESACRLSVFLGLSPSPCLRRVRQLESGGVNAGCHAAADRSAVGCGFHVLLHVEVAAQDTATIGTFESAVTELDEVVHCLRLFGKPDYLFWVAVPDLQTYERFCMAELTGLPGRHEPTRSSL
ncbi:Lrp/AsnC family transcriptional regulator [Streptomyces indonesiensis]